MDDIEMLRARRMYAKTQCSKIYQEYQTSKEETDRLYARLTRSRDYYEETDLEMAEIDGRLTKLPPSSVKKGKKVEAPTMTMDQIVEIAKKVGIVLDLGEECNLD